ncbi:hypothetical protein PG993_012034 [Apiospora rasikravindrae]|uniref:Uncharacterized protein n=1 Tax=Apiospora rasikravindrae TaxID=990691 RepID=A0ABR1S1G4_9PEZI
MKLRVSLIQYIIDVLYDRRVWYVPRRFFNEKDAISMHVSRIAATLGRANQDQGLMQGIAPIAHLQARAAYLVNISVSTENTSWPMRRRDSRTSPTRPSPSFLFPVAGSITRSNHAVSDNCFGTIGDGVSRYGQHRQTRLSCLAERLIGVLQRPPQLLLLVMDQSKPPGYGPGSGFGSDLLASTCHFEPDWENRTYDIPMYPLSILGPPLTYSLVTGRRRVVPRGWPRPVYGLHCVKQQGGNASWSKVKIEIALPTVMSLVLAH